VSPRFGIPKSPVRECVVYYEEKINSLRTGHAENSGFNRTQLKAEKSDNEYNAKDRRAIRT
jgi:hypothetical protein